MSLTVTINQTIVSILNDNNCKVDRTIDMSNTASFTAVDLTGTQHWQPGQPVSITDSLLGLVFTGYADNIDETNLYPNPGILSKVSCVGTRYLADKSYYNGQEFSNRLAGDIVTEFLSQMAADGVKAQYNKAHDSSFADWSTGTLSNTAPSYDLGGCLELAPAGSQLNATYSASAPFPYTTVGGHTSGSTVTCNQMNAIQYVADCVISGLSNAYIYTKVWSGSHTIVNGDFLNYDVWVNNTSPAIQASVDFSCSDGTTYHGASVATWDTQRLKGLPSDNLVGLADNKWYSRSFGLNVGALAGKTITSISLVFGANQTGHYTAYFRRVNVNNFGTPVITVIADTSTALPQLPQIINNNGYTNMLCNVVTAYDSTATITNFTAGRIDMTPAGIYNTSLVSWLVDLPANCAVISTIAVDAINASDVQAVYLQATNNAPIPGLEAGMSIAGLQVSWFVFLYNNGPDPTVTPVFHSLNFQINPSYQANKSDYHYKIKNDSDYTAGVLSANLKEASQVLQMNGFQANFTSSVPSCTAFGASNPSFYLNNRTLALQSDTGNDARLRLDFAGSSWQNGIVEVDVQAPVTNAQTGVVYRCVNWGTGNNTFAYTCVLTSTSLILGYGNNSTSSSAGSFTTLVTVPVSLNAGDYHRLKVIFNGSNHSAYIDDVQYINTTDATYSAAGYVGLRYINATGTNAQLTGFYNFGVAAAFSGTWVSPAFSLASVGTVLAAYTRTQGAGDASQSSLLTEISFDGGTTWNTCSAPPIMTTNTGSWTYDSETIPGLAPGTPTSSLTNCKLRLTLTVSSVAAHLETHGTLFYVLSSYSASGQRLSRPLSINGVSRIGSASLSWIGQAPANTNIQIESSKDGVTWHVEGVGASGGVSVSGYNTQPDPLIDSFDTISSSNYLNTSHPGDGTPATWYYDTVNSRLQATGGAKALYINQTLTINDGSIICDLDYSNGGGLILDYSTISGSIYYYYLVVNDSAASIGTPNTMTLYKQGASTVYNLASASINFQHNTPHRFVFTNVAGTLSASMDGTQYISFNDVPGGLPLVTGQVGLFSNGGSSEFYQLYVQGLGDSVLSGSSLNTRVTLTSTDPTQTPQLQDLAVSLRAGNIHDGAIIPNTSYSVLSGTQNTIAQNLDDMAKQSNTVWWIDDTLNLNFQHKLGQPAPWIATGSSMIASSIKVSNIQPGYRNTKWLSNGHDFVSKTQTIQGDGQTTSWDLGYPVQTIQSMLLDGYAVSFAPKGQTGAQFYYETGKTTITADPSTRILGGLDKLVIQYVGQVTITVKMKHHKASKKRKATEGGNTSGNVELVQDATGLNKQAALQFAYGLLNEYTQTGRQIVFTTMNVGLAPGQLLTTFLPQFNLFDDTLVITDVSIVWQKTNQNGVMVVQPFFTVTAVEGAIVGDWTRLFTRLGKT